MAQGMFPMLAVRYDAQHEKLQRLRQEAILQCVSMRNAIIPQHIALTVISLNIS